MRCVFYFLTGLVFAIITQSCNGKSSVTSLTHSATDELLSTETAVLIEPKGGEDDRLDYTKLGEQDPCEFFDIKKIVVKYNLDGDLSFVSTPGNSAELPHCELHWQIGNDSIRIIRTYVFKYKPSPGNMENLMKSCRGKISDNVERLDTHNPNDCSLYGYFNWGGVNIIPDGARNYVRVEFEYRNEEPISKSEHQLRKKLGLEIAEMLLSKLSREG